MFSCVLVRFLTGIGMMLFTLLCCSLCTRKYRPGKTGFFSLKPEFPSCLSKAGVTGRYMVYISQSYKRQAFSILFPWLYLLLSLTWFWGQSLGRMWGIPSPLGVLSYMQCLNQLMWLLNLRDTSASQSPSKWASYSPTWVAALDSVYSVIFLFIEDTVVVLEYGFDCWNGLVYEASK